MSIKLVRMAILITALACTGWAHSRLPITTRGDLGKDFVPSPIVASTLAFGFNGILADYHWLQAVQVAGGSEIVDADKASQLGKLVDVVTTLNPHVGHPYRFAAVWMTHNDELVRDGNRLLERAIEYHPDDWRNQFYLGFNHFFHLFEYPEAAAAIEAAMALPGSPAYLPRLVARLKSQSADIDVAEIFLRELLNSTEDDEARAKLLSALDEIEIEYKARHLDRSRAAYLRLSGHDIASVADLSRNPYRVLQALPSAEPDAIPPGLSRGSVWELNPDSGQIQSTYLGSRYQIHYSGRDLERQKRWLTDQAEQADSLDGGTEG